MHNNEKPLRVGVVGCGYWGSKHVRVLSSIPGVSVSVIDRDEGKRRGMEASYPIANSCAELSDAIPHLDALVIATPPVTHYPIALEALKAGLHVMVEKPFTTTEAHGQELIDIAEEKDLRIMVGHTFEFNPAVWALKEQINDPAFGKVRYINSARLNLGLYQPDVDVMWDLAPHDISILNFILDSAPTSVHAWGLNLMGEKADVAYIGLRYGDIDVNAKIHVSWLDPMKVRRTTVVGENAMAVYDDVAEERLRIYDKGVKQEEPQVDTSGSYPLSYRNGSITSPFINFEEPLKLELTNFVESIRTGLTPACDGHNGLDVVRVLRAADTSMVTGQWVDIENNEVIDLRTDAPAVAVAQG